MQSILMVIEQDVSVLFGTSLSEFMVISKLKVELKKKMYHTPNSWENTQNLILKIMHNSFQEFLIISKSKF